MAWVSMHSTALQLVKYNYRVCVGNASTTFIFSYAEGGAWPNLVNVFFKPFCSLDNVIQFLVLILFILCISIVNSKE